MSSFLCVSNEDLNETQKSSSKGGHVAHCLRVSPPFLFQGCFLFYYYYQVLLQKGREEFSERVAISLAVMDNWFFWLLERLYTILVNPSPGAVHGAFFVGRS